jgi:hypothetical protein
MESASSGLHPLTPKHRGRSSKLSTRVVLLESKKTYRETRRTAPLLLNSALDADVRSASRYCRFISEETAPGSNRRLVGPNSRPRCLGKDKIRSPDRSTRSFIATYIPTAPLRLIQSRLYQKLPAQTCHIPWIVQTCNKNLTISNSLTRTRMAIHTKLAAIPKQRCSNLTDTEIESCDL